MGNRCTTYDASAIDHYEEAAERLADLTRAVNDLLATAAPVRVPYCGPVTHYRVHPGYLTVLSRIVRDGCTYKEATDG